LVDHRVILNRVRELRELLARRQLTVDQQISNLEEVAFFCELLDRNSPIQQHARVAIDERDLALARCGDHEAGIEREQAVVFRDPPDIENVLPERAALDVGSRLFSRRQVRQLKLLLGHAFVPSKMTRWPCSAVLVAKAYNVDSKTDHLGAIPSNFDS